MIPIYPLQLHLSESLTTALKCYVVATCQSAMKIFLNLEYAKSKIQLSLAYHLLHLGCLNKQKIISCDNILRMKNICDICIYVYYLTLPPQTITYMS